ncbi:hypothetical protein PV726_47065 [Streptomyces europaeiscabiei]|uniref:hypothetical protein n=1 Tax=Streptomyces europaeiscabiei TaxID=146819 RepID=UPI0029A0D346|nr:hypothetical protein [Streptomyces europaeiscabiei]MDX3697620.1 hypothetical protein [Streptomyces europaeiscabiei]
MQATRERLAAEQAERDAQAEQARAAEWARIQQEVEERQAVEDDRRDDGLVMSQHGPEEIFMGAGRRLVTVKRMNPNIWHVMTRGAVYVVSKEGGDDWPGGTVNFDWVSDDQEGKPQPDPPSGRPIRRFIRGIRGEDCQSPL